MYIVISCLSTIPKVSDILFVRTICELVRIIRTFHKLNQSEMIGFLFKKYSKEKMIL